MSNQTTEINQKAEQDRSIQPVLGRADHRLDPKRRFTIPTDWYERMGRPGQIYALPSLSRARCVDVFCPSEFDRRMEKFRNAALSDATKAGFISRLGELVNCVAVDTQNRVRIKDSLLNFAGLEEGDVVLIGAGNHIEVWSLANRPKIDGTEADAIARLAEEAAGFEF